MIDVDDIAVNQENIPPQGVVNLLSKNKVSDVEAECRLTFFELQNTDVYDPEDINGQEVAFQSLMEKNDLVPSQNDQSTTIVKEILDQLIVSITSESSSAAIENFDGCLAEESNSLSCVRKEGETLFQYGCDFLASGLEGQQTSARKSPEVAFAETVFHEQKHSSESQNNLVVFPLEACFDEAISFEPNIDAPEVQKQTIDADRDRLDLMPTQVDSGAQKLDEKEELQSDLSAETSPAHSCKTDTMSDCLSNGKEMFDVNTNPCCQTPQSDVENNDRMFFETEQSTVNFSPKCTNENELSGVDENVVVNGESGNLLTDRRDSILDATVPISTRKPLIGVASVNRRPSKTETKAILEEQTSTVQATNLSEAGPQVAEFTEEEFRSCAEVFKDADSFEFLQKAGSSAALQESALSRLSLYVKFDPLVKARTPVREQNPNSHSTEHPARHINAPAKLKSETIEEESFSDKDKSIAIAKLIDFTPEKKDTPKAARMASVEPLQKEQKLFTDGDMKKAMQIQDLLYRERILSKDRELQQRDKRLHNLEKENAELHTSLKTTRCMMEEVVLMLRQWQSKFEQERVGSVECNQKLFKERDQALEDLQNVETAFADLHRRYEKTKGILENMKQNETALREQVAESGAKLKKQEQMYEVLRTRSEEKLESANSEIETARRNCHSEMAVLGAQLKKAEMKIGSLERSVDQKNQEYIELCRIYDDLIARVGQRS